MSLLFNSLLLILIICSFVPVIFVFYCLCLDQLTWLPTYVIAPFVKVSMM